MEAERERILADARSVREAMRRLVRYASDATEKVDERIEAGGLRGALERVQALSLEVSEELDAYQNKHAS